MAKIIQPLSDRILVDMAPPSSTPLMVGGIYVDKELEVKILGFITVQVLAVGPACINVKAGDQILVHNDKVNEVKFGDQVAQFVNEGMVVAILHDEARAEVAPSPGPVD